MEDGSTRTVKPTTRFKNLEDTTNVPFSIQADIECMIVDIPDKHWEEKNIGHGTRKRLRKEHVPIMAAFSTTANEEIDWFQPIMKVIRKRDNDHYLMLEFCEEMSKECRIHDRYFQRAVPIKMSRKDLDDYDSSPKCHLCSSQIYPTTGCTTKFGITVTSRDCRERDHIGMYIQ